MTTIESDKQNILQMYNDGRGMSYIGQKLGYNPGTLHYYMNKVWKSPTRKLQKFPRTQDNKDVILSMFNDGNSCYSISNKLNIPKPNIIRFLNKIGVDTSAKSTQRKDKLSNHTNDIINMYLSGLSTNKIAKYFNANQSNIWKLLSKNNIKTRDKTTYTVNESYFEKVDTQEKAYILGWMYSDGNVMKDRWRIQIQQQDSYILEWIAKEVGYNGPLYTIPPRKQHSGRKWQTCLNVSRSKMVKDLEKLGCMMKKSLVIKFPDESVVPPHLKPHFIRGVFDGDGSVRRTRKNSIQCGIIGSRSFISGLISSLELDNLVYKLYERKSCLHLVFSKRKNAINFLSFIYNNSKIHLSRKFNIYANVD